MFKIIKKIYINLLNKKIFKKKSTYLKFRHNFNRFNINGDQAIFDFILSDTQKNGGILKPNSHWNWNLNNWSKEINKNINYYTELLYQKKYSNLQMLLEPFIGVNGMQQVNEDSIKKYEGFLRKIDNLNMLPKKILKFGKKNGYLETDLGTIMDCNLIFKFSKIDKEKRISIIEIGGGYGRLAEVFIGGGGLNFTHYLLVDVTPGSLMYSYLYLKNQHPELNIGAYFNGDEYSSDFDCYIMPGWHLDKVISKTFDISINIESMQEMDRTHVDYYINQFDRLIKSGGLVYLSNSRDYIFNGKLNIPEKWSKLFDENTPRSWTKNHPTQIYRKI